ncbi:MAG: MogA/MoaB family molybdenum cofactor biosynthesis protein [Planctomycetota bacterium]|nr:MAG: MogA/MoaB family molybdenum cofactor biosynthesis protein [Planctomycetota bacterium]
MRVMNRAVVLTISDRCSRGDAVDASGPALIENLPSFDAQLIHREVLPDETERIRETARVWIGRCELLLTTGGTGIAARDVTPEALAPLLERTLPGFGEVMRIRAFDQTPLAIAGRGGAGVAKKTLIVWMPGSPKAVRECVDLLAPAIRHICQFLRGESPH